MLRHIQQQWKIILHRLHWFFIGFLSRELFSLIKLCFDERWVILWVTAPSHDKNISEFQLPAVNFPIFFRSRGREKTFRRKMCFFYYSHRTNFMCKASPMELSWWFTCFKAVTLYQAPFSPQISISMLLKLNSNCLLLLIVKIVEMFF